MSFWQDCPRVEEEQEVITLTDLKKSEITIPVNPDIDSQTMEVAGKKLKAPASPMKQYHDQPSHGQEFFGRSFLATHQTIHTRIAEASPDLKSERVIPEVQDEAIIAEDLIKPDLQGDPSQLDDIGNVDITDPYFSLRPTQIPK